LPNEILKDRNGKGKKPFAAGKKEFSALGGESWESQGRVETI